MSTLQQRVRATMERRKHDEQRKLDRAHDAKMLRAERKAIAEEERLDRLIEEGELYTDAELDGLG